MDHGLPGSSAHGILQARIMEWPFTSPGISEVIVVSPSNLDSSLFFIQPRISHDVLCIEVKQAVTVYSLEVLLILFGTSLLFHVQF